MSNFRRATLYRNALKIISECVQHLHDEDLSTPEARARETLVGFCDLLVKRWTDPNYGRDGGER
jgi:hypothetical protein